MTPMAAPDQDGYTRSEGSESAAEFWHDVSTWLFSSDLPGFASHWGGCGTT